MLSFALRRAELTTELNTWPAEHDHLTLAEIARHAMQDKNSNLRHPARGFLDGANLLLKIVQLLLERRVLLCHLFIFLLPLVAFLLESLDLALEVAGLYVGLAEPAANVSICQTLIVRTTYFSFASRSVLSASSASSSSSCRRRCSVSFWVPCC